MADNLKDLLRFLRRDDPESREVFKQVCAWNIVSKDLIPIIEHYQDEHNLVLNAGIVFFHLFDLLFKLVFTFLILMMILLICLFSEGVGVSHYAYRA